MLLVRKLWELQPPAAVQVKPSYAQGLLQLSAHMPGTTAVPPNEFRNGPQFILDFPGTPSLERRSSLFGPVTGTFTSSMGGTGAGKGYRPDASTLNTIFAATGEATVLVLLRSNTTDASGNGGPMVLPSYASSAQHYPYTDGNIYIGPMGNPRYVNAVAPPSSIYDPHTLIATHKVNEQRCYFNGALIGSGTHTEVPFILTDGTSSIGGNGAVYLFVIWSRVLTPQECETLGRNPWALFQPKKIWVPESSGPADSLRSETVTFSSSQTGIPDQSGSRTETVTLSHSQTGIPDQSGARTETVTFSESETGTATNDSQASDTVTLSSSQTGVPDHIGARTETVTFSESETGVPDQPGTRTETVTFSSSQTGSGIDPGSVDRTETVTFTSSQTGVPDQPGARTETVTFSESETGVDVTPSRTQSDIVTFSAAQSGFVPGQTIVGHMGGDDAWVKKRPVGSKVRKVLYQDEDEQILEMVLAVVAMEEIWG